MRCQALDQAKVHLQKEKLPTKQSNGQPACATNCQKTVLQIGPRQLTGGHIRGYPPYNEGVAEPLNATALKTTSFRPKIPLFQKQVRKTFCIQSTGPPSTRHHANRTTSRGLISPLWASWSVKTLPNHEACLTAITIILFLQKLKTLD